MELIHKGITIASASVTGDTLPIGSTIPWFTDSTPDNWLLANGQEISRTLYSELFALWGTTFGVGDGSTTFNVIDMRDYVPVGKSATDTNINTIGQKYGAKTHTLTKAEMDHNHLTQRALIVAGGGNWGVNAEVTSLVNITQVSAHNNMQPSIATNFIIKAKQSSGVVATVVDALTSTSATNALSANMGKVLNEKFIRHAITAATTGTFTTTSLSDNKIPLTVEEVKVGTKLSVSSGNVLIGTGVTKVMVSASIYYQSGMVAGDIIDTIIRKNGFTVIDMISRAVSTNYQAVVLPSRLLTVTAGDTIQLYCQNENRTGSIINCVANRTYLTVEVIE